MEHHLLANISAAGNSSNNKRRNGSANDPPLRQGKWTREEEEYVQCLIDEFKTGMMPLAEGTSLRTFLSKMLNCHPMRISKKFVGSNYAGKTVYSRRPESNRLSNEEVRERRSKLCDLERKFLAKIQGKAGAAATPSASSMEAVAASISGGANSLSFPSLGGASGVNCVSVSASDLELHNLINQATSTQGHANSEAPLPLNVSLIDNNGSSSNNGLGSTQSLQNLFSDLANGNGNGNILADARGLSTSDSLQAFQALMHHQQPNVLLSGTTQHTHNHHQHKSNSRAAAAGRALLQSGGGLGLGGGGGSDTRKASIKLPPNSNRSSSTANKPLAEFTSAELAAELQKRSSLKDLMASLGGGTGTGNAENVSHTSITSFQDSLQQSQSASAFSNLIRNSSLASSIDMSSLIERQGSIESLSNLAIRSHLQSIQSMGSLLDPLLDGSKIGGSNNGHCHQNNSTWTPSGSASFGRGSSNLGMASAALNMNSFLAAKGGDMFNGNARGRNLMQSLGSTEQLRHAINNSGLDLASLLNNEDALRRLEAMPSSLNKNFPFNAQDNSAQALPQLRGPGTDSHFYATAAASADQNTAIAQFLLQKKFMEQQQQTGGGHSSGNDDEQKLKRNVAAASSVSCNAGGAAAMNPMMPSLFSSTHSGGGNGGSADRIASQQEDNSHNLRDGGINASATMESLKRNFFSGNATQEEIMVAMEEHRRNKPFRC